MTRWIRCAEVFQKLERQVFHAAVGCLSRHEAGKKAPIFKRSQEVGVAADDMHGNGPDMVFAGQLYNQNGL